MTTITSPENLTLISSIFAVVATTNAAVRSQILDRRREFRRDSCIQFKLLGRDLVQTLRLAEVVLSVGRENEIEVPLGNTVPSPPLNIRVVEPLKRTMACLLE